MRVPLRLAVCFTLLAAPVAGLQTSPHRAAAHRKPNASSSSGGGLVPPRSKPHFWLGAVESWSHAAAALNKSMVSLEGSHRQVWQQVAFLQEKTPNHFMSYPARVLIIIILFFAFERCADITSYAARGFLRKRSREAATDALQVVSMDCNRDPDVLVSLKVLTFNVYVSEVRENLDLQLKAIRELAPDVICLQEVFHLDVLNAYATAFHDYELLAFGRDMNCSAVVALLVFMIGVASIISFAVWLVEHYVSGDRLKTVWTIAVPVILVVYSRMIRDHWTVHFLTGNKTGLAMLVRSDVINVKERQCMTFSLAGHAGDTLNFMRPRGFISAAGTVRLPSKYRPLPIRLLTTHLNQPIEQALGGGRHRQVKEIFGKALRSGEFAVLGADLNSTPPGTFCGSACNTYTDVVQELKDAWDAVDPNDPSREGATWDPGANSLMQRSFGLGALLNLLYGGVSNIRWRCDYIFWRHDRSAEGDNASEKNNGEEDKREDVSVAVRSCMRVFTGEESISDHFGVFAIFDIRAN